MKKIAIVTGASSGMGADFAFQLAKDYQYLCIDELWIVARRKEKLAAVKEKISNIKGSPAVRVIEQDLTGTEGAKQFQNLLLKEKANGDFEITVLVNNAGFGTYGPFEETPIERQLEMIDLNCTSLVGLCGYALPYLTENSFIINTASLASFSPLGNFSVYAATKAFVLSFSISLAAELKPKGISVLALCPGSVSTEFANVASNGARKEVLHGISSEKTVRHALKKAFAGKHTALYAFKWKVKAFLSRFTSQYTVAEYTYKHCKRPYRSE